MRGARPALTCARRSWKAARGGASRSVARFRARAAGAGPGARGRESRRQGSPEAASPLPADRIRDRTCTGGESYRGAVTAEFAVALPAVVLLLALLLAGSAAGVTQLRLEEAARAGARALARGEDVAAVDGIVRRLAGESAGSSVASDGEWLSVVVSGRVPGAVGSLLPWTLSARAWVRGEASEAAALDRISEVYHRQSLRQGA